MTANHRIYPAYPLSVTVGTSSTMILPPMAGTLTAATTLAWRSGVVYPQGSIVHSAGRYYWAPLSGTAGATAPVHADGDVQDGRMVWRRVRGLREVLSITNVADAPVFIARGYPAELNKGLVLSAAGSLNEGYESGWVRPCAAAYFAIATSAVTLAISEG